MKRQKNTRNTKVEIPKDNPKKEVWNQSNGYLSFKLTDSQLDLADKIEANTLTFVEGSAGTGKSLTVLHTFVKEYLKDKTKQIIVIRTPVEAGMDKIGALPNDYFAKIEPHFDSTKRLLEQLLSKGKVEADMNHRLHFKIPNYAIGSTFDNALVMVDECFTDEHEFLTTEGWKNVSEVSMQDKVMQYDTDGSMSFVSPSRVIAKEYKGTVYRMNTKDVEYAVTANHNLVIYEGLLSSPKLVKACELPENTKGSYIVACSYNNPNAERVISLVKANEFKHLISTDSVLGEYAENLIDELSGCTGKDLRALLEHILPTMPTAGWIYNFRTVYTTEHKSNIDIIQALSLMAGLATTCRKADDLYVLEITDSDLTELYDIKDQADPEYYKGMVYCVTVPSGMLVTRCNHKVHISGNCQQLSPMILKLILERTGQNSKVVVIGDNTQLYADNRNLRNALKDALPRFFKGYPENPKPKFDDIAYHRFTVEDVMRSDIVKSVITAYS